MLFEIVKEGKIYEPEFKLQRQEYDQLIELAKKGKGDIAAYIQKRRTVKVDLWKDIFENYFGIVADGSNGVVTETGTLSIQDPQQLITDFIKNRNHVAHNKPLTYQAYKRMEKSISDMNHLVTKANRMFEESIPSEEMNQTWSAYQDEIETEEQRKYWKKNYLRIRIEGETGVEILWHNDIFELFCEVAANLYTTFHDRYYFDEQYGVSEENALEDSTEWQTVFNVRMIWTRTAICISVIFFTKQGKLFTAMQMSRALRRFAIITEAVAKILIMVVLNCSVNPKPT